MLRKDWKGVTKHNRIKSQSWDGTKTETRLKTKPEERPRYLASCWRCGMLTAGAPAGLPAPTPWLCGEEMRFVERHAWWPLQHAASIWAKPPSHQFSHEQHWSTVCCASFLTTVCCASSFPTVCCASSLTTVCCASSLPATFVCSQKVGGTTLPLLPARHR